MINLVTASGRFLLGVVAAFCSATVFAATYNISLFQVPPPTGGGGTGSGSFEFTNPGAAGSFPTPGLVTLSTNAFSTAGARTFVPGSLIVEVFPISFTDNKPERNIITGNFVEGLTGSLSTTPQEGAFGCTSPDSCLHRITFSFIGNSIPSAATKTYSIDVVRVRDGQVLSTPVLNQPYAVRNITTIPEPGGLALLALGLAALAGHQFYRRRRLAT